MCTILLAKQYSSLGSPKSPGTILITTKISLLGNAKVAMWPDEDVWGSDDEMEDDFEDFY